jgi:DNA-binding NtrC family response regulator
VPLDRPLVVGRAAGADLQVVDGKVSREHCRIQVGSQIVVEDLGSQNGTFVNGVVISQPTPVCEGDEIGVGDTLFMVAGDNVDVAQARYGDGTLLVAPPTQIASRPAAVAPASPLQGLGDVAARLLAAPSEEEAAAVVLNAIEAELQPRRASLLVRVNGPRGWRIVPLATRGDEALASVSRTLLGLCEDSRRGVLVEDASDHRELRGARSVVLHSLRSVMVAPWGQVDGGPRGYVHVDRDADRPFTPAHLAWLETLAGMTALRLDSRTPAPPAASVPVGTSPAFREALRLAEAAARVDSTVLLLGESGTGKEELARFIHARSRRAAGPFVAVNCGAIAEALAESELYGHEKGAFTGAVATRLGAFETADGGTLLLDEIGDLPASLQVKLLRVLQERVVVRVGSTVARPVDVRLLAATHRSLPEEVKAGRLREDLYFRLDVLSIPLPPLRQRREDIPLLACALLERTAARLGLRAPEFSPAALAALGAWDFPGNVRELGNVLERVLVLRDAHDPGPVDADDVQAALGRDLRAPTVAGVEVNLDGTLGEAVARLEKASIEAALRRARGVKSHAAKLLGISRPTLDKKIAELNIDIWA